MKTRFSTGVFAYRLFSDSAAFTSKSAALAEKGQATEKTWDEIASSFFEHIERTDSSRSRS